MPVEVDKGFFGFKFRSALDKARGEAKGSCAC